MQRVNLDEVETQDGVIHYWHGQPFTGIGYELRPDGKLWDEIEYVNGRRQGLSREWFPSGQLQSETAYFDGGGFGPHREWDEAGRLTLSYEMGPDHPNYGLLQKYRATYGADPRRS